jgi:hypothetical protein
MKQLLFILIASISFSCHSQNCVTLPNSYKSYNEAIARVESSSFKFSESANTSKSSWIRKAHYYSCDGETGYFIIQENDKTYIHANVPISIWKDFKNAVSFGSYYDHYIRHKFPLYLN